MSGASGDDGRRLRGSSRPARSDFTADRLEEDSAAAFDARRESTEPRLQWPLVSILIGLALALGVVANDHFRWGAVLFALSVGGAFVLRLVLSEREAGWLAVRTRRIDLVVLGVLSASLILFSVIVPSPS